MSAGERPTRPTLAEPATRLVRREGAPRAPPRRDRHRGAAPGWNSDGPLLRERAAATTWRLRPALTRDPPDLTARTGASEAGIGQPMPTNPLGRARSSLSLLLLLRSLLLRSLLLRTLLLGSHLVNHLLVTLSLRWSSQELHRTISKAAFLAAGQPCCAPESAAGLCPSLEAARMPRREDRTEDRL